MSTLSQAVDLHKLSQFYFRPQQLVAGTTTYLQQSLRFDLVAGLTVAMVAIPQSMAYAAIAGVNPIYGLYAAIVPAIIGALFGSSNHLVTGPTNATALAIRALTHLPAASSTTAPRRRIKTGKKGVARGIVSPTAD